MHNLSMSLINIVTNCNCILQPYLLLIFIANMRKYMHKCNITLR